MSAITTDAVRQGPTFAGTFWVQGVLLRLVIVAVLFVTMTFEAFSAPILAAFLVTDLVTFIWSLSRYNTAAMNYLKNTLRFWTVLGGYLFFFFSAFVAILAWWLVLSDFDHGIPKSRITLKEVIAPHIDGKRYLFEFSRDNKAIHFKGVITPGAVVDFEKFARFEDKLETVVLTSTGGDVYEAREFAKDIGKFGLNTHVDTECNSSCLLLFAAGKNRTLGPGAKIGAHRYGLDFEQLRPNIGLIPEMRIDQQFLLERGIALEFLENYLNLERESIWYPSKPVLMNAGVLTK